MILHKYFKEVKARCDDSRKMIFQSEATRMFRRDAELLLKLLYKTIEERDYYINTKWPEGGIAPPMIEAATEELESLIQDAEVQG